ncbi:hypothetical protein PHPALM_27876, partial [Phytophthora palmivora]
MMRLTSFLGLLLATFVVMCIGFTSADNIFAKNVNNGLRRLHMSYHVQEERGPSDAFAKLMSGLMSGDDAVAKLSKIIANSDSAFKATDDEVAKMSVLIKKANAGNGIGLTDDEIAKFA